MGASFSVTTTSQPSTTVPKPVTTTPKPTTVVPKPATTTSQPAPTVPKPSTVVPKPSTVVPKPATTVPASKPTTQTAGTKTVTPVVPPDVMPTVCGDYASYNLYGLYNNMMDKIRDNPLIHANIQQQVMDNNARISALQTQETETNFNTIVLKTILVYFVILIILIGVSRVSIISDTTLIVASITLTMCLVGMILLLIYTKPSVQTA